MTEVTSGAHEAQAEGVQSGGTRPSPEWSWIAPTLVVGGLIAARAVAMGTCV
jgi:hypothetical protein